MHPEPIESTNHNNNDADSSIPASPIQHGYLHQDDQVSYGDCSECSESVISDDSRFASLEPDASDLEWRLRGLNIRAKGDHPFSPGRRIFEYENARINKTPKRALGFKVVKSTSSDGCGPDILGFPNGSSVPRSPWLSPCHP